MPATRIRSHSPTAITVSGGGGSNPAGSSLTVDAVSLFDILLGESSPTPADAALFDLAVLIDDPSATPVDGRAWEIMQQTDTVALPVGAHNMLVTFTTTGAGTWVCPAGVTSVTAECYGGGGGGQNGTATTSGGGGGGGAYSKSVLPVVPGTTYNLNVGAIGGAGATGSAGGDSWFNTSGTILAKGGAAGGGTRQGGQSASGIGTVKFSGGNGAASAAATYGGGGGEGAAFDSDGVSAPAPTATASNGGAGTAGGNGGSGGAAITGGAGVAGTAPGGGGGGGGFSATSPGAGANGARGEIRLSFRASRYYVQDTFTRADSTSSLGSTEDPAIAWNVLAGTWGITSNQAYVSSSVAGGQNGAVVETGLSDVVVTVTANYATAESGVIFRCIDNSNYMIYTAGGSGLANGAFYKRVGGTFTFLGGGAASAWSDGDTLTVIAVGSSLTTLRNGSVVGPGFTDSTHLTATQHGLRVYSNVIARLDNFSVS